MVNANNRGYCKVILSQEEINFFGTQLTEIESLDSLNRAYLWRILWSHVRSGATTIKYYMDTISAGLPKELNEDVIVSCLKSSPTV